MSNNTLRWTVSQECTTHRTKFSGKYKKRNCNLHLWVSSLSSESPHLSASSGVGLQMKAERFFNKPISARFLIVWPIRRTLSMLNRWVKMQMQTLPLSQLASTLVSSLVFHICFYLVSGCSTESHESALLWWGEAFIIPLNATWKAGGRRGGGEGWLQPANQNMLLGLEPSYLYQCLSAPCCLSSYMYPTMKYASLMLHRVRPYLRQYALCTSTKFTVWYTFSCFSVFYIQTKIALLCIRDTM